MILFLGFIVNSGNRGLTRNYLAGKEKRIAGEIAPGQRITDG